MLKRARLHPLAVLRPSATEAVHRPLGAQVEPIAIERWRGIDLLVEFV